MPSSNIYFYSLLSGKISGLKSVGKLEFVTPVLRLGLAKL